MGVLDTMDAATPRRRSVTMCLDGATQAKIDAIDARLQSAVDVDTARGSLANPTPTAPTLEAAVEEREALRDEIAASEVTFTFETLDWTGRVALQAAHPPRQGNMPDAYRGYNVETYVPAVIRKSCVLVVDAAGDESTEVPDTTWDRLLGAPARPATDTAPARPAVKGTLNVTQVNKLFAAANAVNDEETAVPPSARSLLESQDSGASLAQPSPGTSRRGGSAGGSRRTSPTSSATKKKAPSKGKSSDS